MFSRRDLLKAGAAGGMSFALPGCDPRDRERTGVAAGRDTRIFQSPPTTPFVMPLPVPPLSRETARFATSCAAQTGAPPTRFFQLVEEERYVQVSPDLPPTLFWGYRDAGVPPRQFPFAVGPTLRGRMTAGRENGMAVRFTNQLPANHRGFGVPISTVHYHGGHNPSLSDGFPSITFEPGESFTYCYPMIIPGTITPPLTNDIPSTMWYHDHLLDFTAQNVYRGLCGFFLVFDDLDTGNETTGLRLPSGPFDVPLCVQDKSFYPDGQLFYDPFNHDGFLGDKLLVNGAIQPFLRVKRRKYRFRFLDGSNARFYQIFLSNRGGDTSPMIQIGNGGGLFSRPIQIESFRFAPAQRAEVVIDFSQFPAGTELFFENRLEQVDGRHPGDLLARGPQIMKLIVDGDAPDFSQVPAVLRPFAPISQAQIDAAVRRTFEFDRDEGAWAINGLLADDLVTPAAVPRLGVGEVWRLVNKAGGWAHPIHVHLDMMRVLKINGELPPLTERDGIAREDTVILEQNGEVEVFLLFNDFAGKFVFHCHNLEHEDMAMMARFDTVY